MRWDIFCRVVDNHGDLGVCWRLAADLASRGELVRLWVDEPAALVWMAPSGAAGVEVVRWREPFKATEPADVVIEAFGCDPPPAFVTWMAARASPPVWINLEYLSAEDHAERNHGLPSPVLQGAGAGLTKWFYFPGFTAASGGLLRGPLPAASRDGLADFGIHPRQGERLVSLFAYADAPFDELFDRLGDRPTLLVLAAGASQAPALQSWQNRSRGHLRAVPLPWLCQADYDRVLAGCDINFARGEDSIVRAMWSGRPFVWHIYRQHDGAHAPKLEALLDRMDAGEPLRTFWRAWNGIGPWPAALPDEAPWRALCSRWRDGLLCQTDLTTRLVAFVASKR
jgi:uncharacterized repeat protein (TIGR03837 family)